MGWVKRRSIPSVFLKSFGLHLVVSCCACFLRSELRFVNMIVFVQNRAKHSGYTQFVIKTPVTSSVVFPAIVMRQAMSVAVHPMHAQLTPQVYIE